MAEQSRVHVVFGAGGGIGSALLERLLDRGCQVVAAGRAGESLDRIPRQGKTTVRPCDATDFNDVEACLRETLEQHDRLDGVVNCVGSLLLKPAHITTADQWHDALATNLTTAFAVVRGAANVLRRTGGSVVLMSSAAARVGLANHEAIAAAKGGVAGLTLAAAASYARYNLRFNAVAPGLVKTPMTRRIWDNPSAAEASRALHPLKRLGEPSDVAALIEWLISPESQWVTGQVYGIDGGLGSIQAS